MIKPEPQIIKHLAIMSRQYPEILEWLEGWEMSELRRLPSAVNQPAVFQGRCQVLNELVTLIKGSPELAAKL